MICLNEKDKYERFLDQIPEEDEVITEEEHKAIERGRKQIENGEYVTLEELRKKIFDA